MSRFQLKQEEQISHSCSALFKSSYSHCQNSFVFSALAGFCFLFIFLPANTVYILIEYIQIRNSHLDPLIFNSLTCKFGNNRPIVQPGYIETSPYKVFLDRNGLFFRESTLPATSRCNQVAVYAFAWPSQQSALWCYVWTCWC